MAAAAGSGRGSTTRRVRARIGRKITSRGSGAVKPVLEPLAAVHRELHPKADLALLQHAYDVAEERHAGQPASPATRTSPTRSPWRRSSPSWAWTPSRWSRRCCTTRSRTPITRWSGCARTSARRSRRLVDGVTKLDKVKLGGGGRGGDHPQDGHRDGPRPAGAGDQAVRPAAQHAHACASCRRRSRRRKARETLEVLAPLAHRLGMATVKWELEDLAFAILHPKKYDEIVRLVANRAPSRDTYLRQVVDEIGRAAVRCPDQRDGRGPAQALLLDLPEDDRPGPGLRRHPRPGRGADRGGGGAGLLRGGGRRARAVAADARPVQGLRRPAPVRRLPVAAHHGDRAGRQAARGADPHPGHAPHRRVRHRRALAVQGDRGATRRRAAGRRGRRDGLDAPAAELAAGGRRPRRVPGGAALRPGHPRDLRVHPEGRRDHAAGRVHAGRLRLRRAHRGRPPVHRCPGQRPAGRPGAQAGERARSSRSSPRRPRAPGRAGTGCRSSPRRGPRPRSSSGSPRSVGRRRSRPARRRSPGRCGAPDCRCSGWSPPDGDGRAGPRAALPGRLRAVRGGGRGPRLGPARGAAAGRAARRRGGRRGGAGRARHAVHGPPRRPLGDAGVVVHGDAGESTDLRSSSPDAAPRCPATRSWAS